MRLLDLSLQNIGPFDEARLEFLSGPDDAVPVAIITGENGTGKTILLDGIRGLFGTEYGTLERAIWRNGTPFRMEATLHVDGSRRGLTAARGFNTGNSGAYGFEVQSDGEVVNRPKAVANGQRLPSWVVDFWRSSLPADSYATTYLTRQDPKQLLVRALKGMQRNAVVTELICHFDYLRGSNVARERQDGEVLYELTRDIVKLSVIDGELSHVERTTFTPMIKQSGQLVPLENLSSGNAYLVQHMIGLLGKMYAVHVLRESDPSELCTTPGLLLIDEADNHLHPRWQKRFLSDVRRIFPNMQIIATTHSPFIVASVPGARVFVCRYDRTQKNCVVEDETDVYVNKPIEDILLSPAFDGTQPFGEEITRLIEQRKAAIETGDQARRAQIEQELKERNPEYFSYLDLDERLQALRSRSQ